MRPGALPIRALTLLALIIAGVTSGCRGGDGTAAVLEERSRWKVELLDWVDHEGQGLTMTTRVSGPVHSKLSWLTVRLELLDAEGEPIQRLWHSFDLSEVERGGPREFTTRLTMTTERVEQIALDPVSQPTEEDAAQLRELQF